MPIGSFDVTSDAYPLYGGAAAAGVYLYTPGAPSPYSWLPNVRCIQVDAREGPRPPVASFQYITDTAMEANLGWPSQFEDIWPIGASGPYVVRPDDRLVVMGRNPDGSPLIYFDGYAEMPQIDVTPESQHVTFTASNVAVRCYDSPIIGRIQRNGAITAIGDDSGDNDLSIDLPCHFNPANHSVGSRGGFLPNCTPDGFDTDVDPDDAAEGTYPVFVNPLLPWTPPIRASYWTVGKAVRYLLAQYNGGEDYVTNPDLTTIDALLQNYYPAPGSQVMNPNDVASYETQPVTVRDHDVTNKPWPVAVAELIGFAGFYMRWDTFADADGLPETTLAFYRRDEFSATPLRFSYLDDSGAAAGDGPNNLARARLVRDSAAIVNAFQVETAQRQVEASIALVPLYQPAGGDGNPPWTMFTVASWNATTSAATRRKYRWYGADELGEGHLWVKPDLSTGWDQTPGDFSLVFPPDEDEDGDEIPTYVQRYRPGSGTLISQDSQGRPIRATLQIVMGTQANRPWAQYSAAVSQSSLSADYPATIYDVPDGWRLLPDRLGIECTEDNPEMWNTGNDEFPHIRGISWWADPPAGAPTYGCPPLLVLTTVLEDDLTIGVTSQPRAASPTRFPRWRGLDGRNHFQYTTVDKSSRYYLQGGGNGTDPYVVRDDTDVAQAHADQFRSAYEFPPLAGSIAIPYITTHYEIGDQLAQIDGRDVYLTTNAGISQGEQPVYPWIVGVSWHFENGEQQTVLVLSDRRADPANSW